MQLFVSFSWAVLNSQQPILDHVALGPTCHPTQPGKAKLSLLIQEG